jgi:hypothetical protein
MPYRRNKAPSSAPSLAGPSLAARLLVLAAPALAACVHAEPYVLPAGLKSPFTGYSSPRYQDPAMWLCRPDLPGSVCNRDRTATEIRPDRSRAVVKPAVAAEPKVDCFYVYPTVDMGVVAGNHVDFSDVEPMARTAFAQAAGFTEACAVYAPLYRQVTIGTYLRSAETREPYFEVAFSDVADAFVHYMANHNHGRKIAIVGHSQGAEMVLRLLKRFFDDDPAMREKLLVAMPIGGHVEVKKGSTTGGSLANIPVCTGPDQLGCVVSYRSHRGGESVSASDRDLPAAGNEVVCTNPADLLGNARSPLARSVVPLTADLRARLKDVEGIETPVLMLRDYYSAQCVDGKDGYRYLAVWEARLPGDVRVAPFDLGGWMFGTKMGLHVLDFQLPQGNLIDLVARRAAALP